MFSYNIYYSFNYFYIDFDICKYYRVNSQIFSLQISQTLQQKQELALSNFRQGKFYNCCQAVISVYDESKLAECQQFGGGRAPEGACGACYAVIKLRPDLEDIAKEEFTKQAASYKCREIKGISKYSCQNCVRLGVQIMEEHK